jgi:hypothetical protein
VLLARGGRPRYPFPYSDECWTGIEYEVAALLIHLGLVEEGLEIVAGVRARYDGEKRNPFDEVECGHHYARALSSWGVLLALSGVTYSAPDRRLGFAPQAAAALPLLLEHRRRLGIVRMGSDRRTADRGARRRADAVAPGAARFRRPPHVSVDGEGAAPAGATGEEGVLVFVPPLSLAAGQTLTTA